MKPTSKVKIIDITKNLEYEKYLHRCLVGPFRRYRKRVEYLKKAIPKGFHKKLLIFDGNCWSDGVCTPGGILLSSDG